VPGRPDGTTRMLDNLAPDASAMLARPDAATAAALEAEDDAMDTLHQAMFTELAQTSPPEGTDAGEKTASAQDMRKDVEPRGHSG